MLGEAASGSAVAAAAYETLRLLELRELLFPPAIEWTDGGCGLENGC